MKWLIKQIVLNLFQNDADFRMEVIKAINPEQHWELKYGNLKIQPPKPSKHLWDHMVKHNR